MNLITLSENVILKDSMNYPIGIEITPKAMKVMHDACKEENKSHLRIGVKGGRMFSDSCIILNV